MRTLRRRSLERPTWPLKTFLSALPTRPYRPTGPARIAEAQSRLADQTRSPKTPLDWAELVPQILEVAGWPGTRPLSSVEFQAVREWQQSVESCAALGFDGRRVRWPEFLSALARAVDETLFSPESRGAPIQIAGPAESAGLTADAIWFMGASESAWPTAANPSSPAARSPARSRMPHATARLDWELARAITQRLLHSAPRVHFSYARQSEDVEASSSRLITNLAGTPQTLPADLIAPVSPEPLTVSFADTSQIPVPTRKGRRRRRRSHRPVAMRLQSIRNCAPRRPNLGSRRAGLTAAQRGQLLHAVLHAIWAGPPHGLRSLQDLQALTDRAAFVADTVDRVLLEALRPSLRARMPRRYLELEAKRLTRLLTEWLAYESTRIEFDIVETEASAPSVFAGLTINLRLDRLDRLDDDTLLVIDYKTGAVKPNAWDLPRPETTCNCLCTPASLSAKTNCRAA